MKRKYPQTYETKLNGETVRVTIPEAIDEMVLFAALKDNFSPQAIAAMASFLSTAVSTVGTNMPEVDSQMNWFVNELVQLLGGNEPYQRLCQEIGL